MSTVWSDMVGMEVIDAAALGAGVLDSDDAPAPVSYLPLARTCLPLEAATRARIASL